MKHNKVPREEVEEKGKETKTKKRGKETKKRRPG